MRLLLDTHTFLWWVSDQGRMGRSATECISSGRNEIYVSVVTAWEIAIKKKLGRLGVPDALFDFMQTHIAKNGFRALPVDLHHATGVQSLPDVPRHKDPFDRLLACQALTEKMALISSDRAFDHYGVERIW